MLQRLRLPIAAAFSLLAVSLFAGEPVTSTPCVIYANPAAVIQWKTAMSNQLRISLDWPTGATTARFAVTAAGKSISEEVLTDTTAASFVYAVDTPEDFDSEKVLDLSLSYLDGNGAVIEERTASIGLVRGVDSASTEVVADGELSAKWAMRKTKSASAVIPVPESSGPLTIDEGEPIATDAPGWYFWSGIAAGSHTLAMNVAGEDWTAEPIIKIPGGLLLLFK